MLADGLSPGADIGHPEHDAFNLLIPSFPGRAEAWKIAGNAIVPQLAAEVLGALLEQLG
jgi:hypothetical protein